MPRGGEQRCFRTQAGQKKEPPASEHPNGSSGPSTRTATPWRPREHRRPGKSFQWRRSTRQLAAIQSCQRRGASISPLLVSAGPWVPHPAPPPQTDVWNSGPASCAPFPPLARANRVLCARAVGGGGGAPNPALSRVGQAALPPPPPLPPPPAPSPHVCLPIHPADDGAVAAAVAVEPEQPTEQVMEEEAAELAPQEPVAAAEVCLAYCLSN